MSVTEQDVLHLLNCYIHAYPLLFLKRDSINIVYGLRGCGGSLAAWRRWRFCLRLLSAVIAAAQHLHFVTDDFVCCTLDAVFVGVFAALDAAFDIDEAAFFQILPGYFGYAAV